MFGYNVDYNEYLLIQCKINKIYLMSVSIAPTSTTQTRIAPLNVSKSANNQSESPKISPSNQSADPRSANTLSPRQSDAILSLASTDGSTVSSQKNAGGTQTLSTANRAYHETDLTVSKNPWDETDFEGEPIGPDDPDDTNTADLGQISVTAPGDSSTGGGGTAPVEGGGGVSPPPVESGGGTAHPGSGSIDPTPVQGSSPGSSTTGTVTIADDVRVEKSAKTEAGFLLDWKDQESTRVGTPDNGAVPLAGDQTAQRLNPNVLITGLGAYVHSGGASPMGFAYCRPLSFNYISRRKFKHQ
ncbi:hypothetical protein [Methylobacterium sp. J-077]|uniref:hypothetical protein n=1 Tax=Methylobacterium sp. J-077 TaxID=2836656 RepID=UPI001FB9D580|nr:hypothetical protein [Methylobacterium sp. J-077]MCJ2123444.1 hypothetical protein [Methylobacterium sp. J-077]